MSVLIGFMLVYLAVTTFIIFMFAWELTTKEKIMAIIYAWPFMLILAYGAYLITSGM